MTKYLPPSKLELNNLSACILVTFVINTNQSRIKIPFSNINAIKLHKK